MLNFIDSYLDRITMYRLVLYYLIVLLGAAFLLSLLGILNYNPLGILFNSIFLVVICYITNRVFASVLRLRPTSSLSILHLSFSPVSSRLLRVCRICRCSALRLCWQSHPNISWPSRKKHIFNPVAIAVVLTAFGFGVSASWWIGNAWMTPLSYLADYSSCVKTRREHMVFMFWAVALAVISIFTLIDGNSYVLMLDQVFLHSSFFFLLFSCSPSRSRLRRHEVCS